MALNYYDLNATTIENRFAGSIHGHGIDDVTNLRTELDSRQSGLTSSSDIVFHNAEIYGNLVPNVNGTQYLGSSTKHFKEAWIDELHVADNTLYLGDTPVIGTNNSIVELTAGNNQGITVKTIGTGETKLTSETSIDILNSGGNINIQSTGTGSQISLSAVHQLNITAPVTSMSGELSISGHSTFNSATFSGDVTFNGTNYVVNTTEVSTSDNRITLNAGELGAGVTAGYAGFEVDRGTLNNWQLVFDETNDAFVYGEVGGTLHEITSKSYIDTGLGNKLNTSTFNSTYTASDVLTKLKTVDGPNSGLDADTLDGYQAADLLMTANQIMDAVKSVDGSGSGLDADLLDGHDTSYFENLSSSSPWQSITSNYTAVNKDRLLIDTAVSAITITLPSSPAIGDSIEFLDASGTWATYNVTILRNGHPILGSNTDLIADVDDARFIMTYAGALEGWKVN